MDLRSQLQGTLGSAYTLERELGGGGMSRVFVGDERRLNRKVVIKVLSPELAAGVSAERFEREIQLAASLQQANIVPILAAGETEGLPFYTMPFVDGESLRTRLSKTGRLPIGTAINVLRDVAKALAYAHQHGVVHRDIKPDNVLLSGGTAVVTDFGIAKAITAARTDTEGGTLTQLGTSIGTPAYMSPEQAAGDPTVDHRADVYSLGCMMYELLSGQPPFHGRPAARVLAAHMMEAPQPIAFARPDVPPALASLVMRCLEKDPAARPESGTEIVQTLDSITSGGMAAMPGALLGAHGTLRRSLAIWAGALVAIAIVARAAIIALGLPDWVFPGAIIVMLLGLPVILFTWYVNRTLHLMATATPTLTPGGSPAAPSTLATLAIKASPHVSWRRAWTGGAMALGGFALIVIAFMALRAMGIGPAGSLLASGKLADRERLIVTEFAAPDSSLSSVVNEAVRTNLSQSRVISIMSPVSIGAALQRMRRPPSTRVDLELAREIAQREGIKAIVDGTVRSLGGGYVVSVRLVSADSANELAAYQETANGPRELLETIDKLTRKLRGKIGESLRDVRGSPPLEHVTTASLDALRKYAEGQRQIDLLADPTKGAESLREAVKLDTGFAMAWRKLGVALNNSGRPRASVDSALQKAYTFRDRLTERERLLAEATYFQLGPGRDRRKAITAYQAVLNLDPNEAAAGNNLANILTGRREFVRAESLYKRAIASGRATQQQYTNLIAALFNSGKIGEAERYANEFQQRFPSAALQQAVGRATFVYHRGQLDSMVSIYRPLTSSDNINSRIGGYAGLTNNALLRGQINESRRYLVELRKALAALGQPQFPINDSLQQSYLDLFYYGDTSRALRRMETTLGKFNYRSLPFDNRPYTGLAEFYALAGQPQRARTFVAQYDADMPDSVTRRIREPGRHEALGDIAMAEGRYPDAVREFWRADTTYDGPDGSCAICQMDDVAMAWQRAGVPDSAIYYYERWITTPYFGREGLDAFLAAPTHRTLGDLYAAKGDAVSAAKHYREFLKRWEHADASLQPQVAEVRRKLSRLSDIESK